MPLHERVWHLSCHKPTPLSRHKSNLWLKERAAQNAQCTGYGKRCGNFTVLHGQTLLVTKIYNYFWSDTIQCLTRGIPANMNIQARLTRGHSQNINHLGVHWNILKPVSIMDGGSIWSDRKGWDNQVSKIDWRIQRIDCIRIKCYRFTVETSQCSSIRRHRHDRRCATIARLSPAMRNLKSLDVPQI